MTGGTTTATAVTGGTTTATTDTIFQVGEYA